MSVNSIIVAIHRRFCGPTVSGNGDYCAGLVAQTIASPVGVTLKRPPPLETPISLVKTAEAAENAFWIETKDEALLAPLKADRDSCAS